jgi:hypothetical protein
VIDFRKADLSELEDWRRLAREQVSLCLRVADPGAKLVAAEVGPDPNQAEYRGLKLIRLLAAGGSGIFAFQFLDFFRRLRFGEVVGHFFAGLLCERVEVRALRAGHRLIAGDPVLGILLRIVARLRGLDVLVGIAHGRLLTKAPSRR